MLLETKAFGDTDVSHEPQEQHSILLPETLLPRLVQLQRYPKVHIFISERYLN